MTHCFSLMSFTQLMDDDDDDDNVRKRERQRQGETETGREGEKGAPSVAHAFLNKL